MITIKINTVKIKPEKQVVNQLIYRFQVYSPPQNIPPWYIPPRNVPPPQHCSGLQLASLALGLRTLVKTGSRQRHISRKARQRYFHLYFGDFLLYFPFVGESVRGGSARGGKCRGEVSGHHIFSTYFISLKHFKNIIIFIEAN